MVTGPLGVGLSSPIVLAFFRRRRFTGPKSTTNSRESSNLWAVRFKRSRALSGGSTRNRNARWRIANTRVETTKWKHRKQNAKKQHATQKTRNKKRETHVASFAGTKVHPAVQIRLGIANRNGQKLKCCCKKKGPLWVKILGNIRKITDLWSIPLNSRDGMVCTCHNWVTTFVTLVAFLP